MDRREEIFRILPVYLRERVEKARVDFSKLLEIRMRIQCPFTLLTKQGEYYVSEEGKLSQTMEKGIKITKEMLRQTMEFAAGYSLYAFEEEVRQGFITIQGGHRVGLAGGVSVSDGKVKIIRYITFLNIRVAHEIKGCADMVLPWLFEQKKLCHTLLISPPKCGKTTLLRDLIRQLSNGSGKDRRGFQTGVVDERSEIAACYLGVPQNDIGIRTDVLDCCPKAEGMLMLVRSMSPEILAVDEIGGREDIKALENVLNSGCKILATIHGGSYEEVKGKPYMSEVIAQGLFERFVVFKCGGSPGSIREILDKKGTRLWREIG